MTPPPSAALALLGVWVLVTVWATSTAAASQARADRRFELPVPEDRSDHSDSPADGVSSDRGFQPADD